MHKKIKHIHYCAEKKKRRKSKIGALKNKIVIVKAEK